MNGDQQDKTDPLEHLPDAIREAILTGAGPQDVLAVAPTDLDENGAYADGYLALSPEALGSFTGQDGQWTGRWRPLADLSEARIVDGIGSSCLRLLTDGRIAAEFRFTLRHARAVAGLHRRLEKLLDAETPAGDDEQGPPHPDEKKLRCEKCGHVIPPWSETCPACLSAKKILGRLMGFVRPHRWRAILGAVLAVSLTGLSLLQPWLRKPMIDDAVMNGDFALLAFYVGLLAALILVGALGGAFQRRIMAKLGSLVARDIRGRVYSHLQKLSLSFFSRKQTGSLVARVTTDSDRLWEFIAFTIIEVAVAFLTLAGVATCLFAMHWKLAIFVLGPVPLMVFLMAFFHKQMRGFFHRWTHHWHQMTAVVTGALPGVRVIKAFGQEDREIDRFDAKSLRVFREEASLIRMFSIYGPLMMLASQIGVIVVWLLGGWWTIQGEIKVGTLVAFTGYMWMFYRPIHMLAHMDRAFNRAAASAQRIFEVLDTQPAVFSRSGATSADELAGGIEFRNVSFSYDGVRKVLKKIDLKIAPGEMIGLAGPSGGGKTTTINLICRFYDALEGQILIDGVDVRDYDLHQLRRHIGVVLQEPFLFHGTVAENIGYGNPGAGVDEILTAAKAANAHDFIVGFPDGYDTVVGERGHTLSGGELQRVSIARAILNNPRILILDEATSSVDTETEALIQDALDRLIAQRTTIAIAHRLSTLRKADRLVILEKGLLVEVGTHEELAQKPDGLYAKLLRMQAEAQALVSVGG